MEEGFCGHGSVISREYIYFQSVFYSLLDLMTISKSHLAQQTENLT